MRSRVGRGICGCSATENRERRESQNAVASPTTARDGRASELERQVTELRLRYPDWGARKLKVLLARQGVELPRNTIHRILQRHDLIGPQERGAAATQRFERERPNELWHMDFKGPKGWPQPMGPLSVLDDHSRYLIALAATGGTHAEPVRQQLEEAFQRCGVPEAMLMDHGTPWWSTHAVRADAVVAMADAAGDSAVLERDSASPNPGQGGTFSWIVATRLATARGAGAEPASLAGCVSLGAQPCTTARSARHANSGGVVETQYPSLRCPSATLGISRWGMGVESGLPRQAGHQREKMEGQPITRRGVGASRSSGATHDGVLLRYPHSRTGPRNPTLENHRALDSDAQFLSTDVKDV